MIADVADCDRLERLLTDRSAEFGDWIAMKPSEAILFLIPPDSKSLSAIEPRSSSRQKPLAAIGFQDNLEDFSIKRV
jgi:hypothetical protein